MFYVLAIGLCFAVLSLLFLSSSVLFFPVVLFARRRVYTMLTESSINVLFAARLFPLLFSAAITLGFALPAFIEFEPHSTGESFGLRLNVLSMTGAILIAAMLRRAWRLQSATSRLRRSWLKNSEKIYVQGIKLPVYCVESGTSLLAMAGILRPKIFLSRDIVEALSPQELKAALKHEIAHVASSDNLKQMLLKVTQPPRWLKAFCEADEEWSTASEIAADRSAVAGGASVLDLSSALIKVGRLNRIPSSSLAVASHLIPPAGCSSLEQRVVHLSALLQSDEQVPVHTSQSNSLRIVLFLGVAAYVACIYAFLPAVHEAMEFLVR